jgi:hypothetical protein
MFRKKSNFNLKNAFHIIKKNGIGSKFSSQLNHIRRRSVKKKKNHPESAAIHFPNQSCIYHYNRIDYRCINQFYVYSYLFWYSISIQRCWCKFVITISIQICSVVGVPIFSAIERYVLFYLKTISIAIMSECCLLNLIPVLFGGAYKGFTSSFSCSLRRK